MQEDSTKVSLPFHIEQFKKDNILFTFTNRLKKIGNMLPWYWIDSFCGFSR